MSKNRRGRWTYTLLLLACVMGFWLFDNFYTPATYSGPKVDALAREIPKDLMPTSTTGAIVAHNYFMLSYSEPYEQAEWVCYLLSKEQLTNDDRDRPYFIEDPKVKTKSADWRNYRGSGYDRGHLCPAGDRRFSKQAYEETFYTSNISPQDREFNAGLWNRLEMQVRQWAKRYGTVFVVTGGVLEGGLDEIGQEDVDVPRQFYKIVARGSGKDRKVLAFLMPNSERSQPLQSFAVSVDAVERLTGIDFFEALPDAQENVLERQIETGDWRFR